MIIVDTREPIEEFKKIFMKLICNCTENELFPEIRFEALKYGDYQIITKNHSMIVERKEFHDYCNSIGSYLQERMEHMRLENDLTMLLIEGNPITFDQHNVYILKGRNVEKGLKNQSIKNFAFSQQLNGSLISHTENFEDTILTLIYYWRYLRKLSLNKKSVKVNSWEKWLSLAPFVGKNLAEKAKNQYNSCMDAILDINEWAKEKTIDGINGNWK